MQKHETQIVEPTRFNSDFIEVDRDEYLKIRWSNGYTWTAGIFSFFCLILALVLLQKARRRSYFKRLEKSESTETLEQMMPPPPEEYFFAPNSDRKKIQDIKDASQKKQMDRLKQQTLNLVSSIKSIQLPEEQRVVEGDTKDENIVVSSLIHAEISGVKTDGEGAEKYSRLTISADDIFEPSDFEDPKN